MTALPAGLAPGTYVIDPSHTEAGFSVRHAMISKTKGRFGGVTGTLVFGDDVGSSSASADIDVTTIDTRDENRDGHLKSPDFFDAATYPTIRFSSTGIRAQGETYLLDGNLTIKDVTKQVTLEVEFNGAATDPFGNQKVGFAGSTEINRKDFGLTWNATLETGGVLVGEKVTITLEVEGNKVQAEVAQDSAAEGEKLEDENAELAQAISAS